MTTTPTPPRSHPDNHCDTCFKHVVHCDCAQQSSPARSDMLDAERANDQLDALEDLRKAVKDEVSDEWLLAFVTQYPFAPRRATQGTPTGLAESAPSGETIGDDPAFRELLSFVGKTGSRIQEERELIAFIDARRATAAPTDDGGCWTDEVPCDKCNQVGWHVCRATAGNAAPEKPFAGPGAWFSTDVLGGPMRQYAPGKWENALWPSDIAGNAATAVPGDLPPLPEPETKVTTVAGIRFSSTAYGDKHLNEHGKACYDAGYASQLPRIRHLEHERDSARAFLASNAGAAPADAGLIGYCHVMNVGKFVSDGVEADVRLEPRSSYPDGPKEGEWMHPVYIGKPFPAAPSNNSPVGAKEKE